MSTGNSLALVLEDVASPAAFSLLLSQATNKKPKKGIIIPNTDLVDLYNMVLLFNYATNGLKLLKQN